MHNICYLKWSRLLNLTACAFIYCITQKSINFLYRFCIYMFILHMELFLAESCFHKLRLCSNMLSIEITDPTDQDPTVFMLKALRCIAVKLPKSTHFAVYGHLLHHRSSLPIISALLESSVFIIMAHPCAHSYIFIIQWGKSGHSMVLIFVSSVIRGHLYFQFSASSDSYRRNVPFHLYMHLIQYNTSYRS